MNLPTVLFVFLWHLAPLRGLATWYGPPLFLEGDTMRNGQGLRLAAATIAVDVSHADWLGCAAIVLTECEGIHFVRITDTGPLYEAGRFRLGISKFTRQLRYWPVVEATPVLPDAVEWREDVSYRIVADVPRDFFLDEVACNGNETLEVRVIVWTR